MISLLKGDSEWKLMILLGIKTGALHIFCEMCLGELNIEYVKTLKLWGYAFYLFIYILLCSYDIGWQHAKTEGSVFRKYCG